jgi:hypothetical protein
MFPFLYQAFWPCTWWVANSAQDLLSYSYIITLQQCSGLMTALKDSVLKLSRKDKRRVEKHISTPVSNRPSEPCVIVLDKTVPKWWTCRAIESDPKTEAAKETDAIPKQSSQAFYPILVTHQITLGSGKASGLLAKETSTFLQSNLGDCYHNSHMRGVICSEASGKLVM